MPLIRRQPAVAAQAPAPIERVAPAEGHASVALPVARVASVAPVEEPRGDSDAVLATAAGQPSSPAPAAPVEARGPEFAAAKGFKVNPLDVHVKAICEAPAFINDAHLTMLTTAIGGLVRRDQAPTSLDGFDMRDEIAAQLAVVRNLRAGLFDSAGKLMAGKDAREAREVITAASNLFSLLMKHEETLDRNARLQAIEQAVYEAFDNMEDPTLRQRFLDLLGEHLAKAA